MGIGEDRGIEGGGSSLHRSIENLEINGLIDESLL